jgi:protein-tyrosine phosphatase
VVAPVSSFVDLHSHWVPGVDDGVRTVEHGRALLRGLRALGFETVVATPHMRPGMFDNDRTMLVAGYDAMLSELGGEASLPTVHLASEHFFDEIVFRRLLAKEGLPYPGGKAILVELPPEAFPARIDARLFDLACHGLLPVVAHPERYRPVWNDPACLDPLLDAGACLLLDACSVVGKYGRAAQRAAEQLLEDCAYQAACSDTHRPEDVGDLDRALARLDKLVGREELVRLFGDGPRQILDGKLG